MAIISVNIINVFKNDLWKHLNVAEMFKLSITSKQMFYCIFDDTKTWEYLIKRDFPEKLPLQKYDPKRDYMRYLIEHHIIQYLKVCITDEKDNKDNDDVDDDDNVDDDTLKYMIKLYRRSLSALGMTIKDNDDKSETQGKFKYIDFYGNKVGIEYINKLLSCFNSSVYWAICQTMNSDIFKETNKNDGNDGNDKNDENKYRYEHETDNASWEDYIRYDFKKRISYTPQRDYFKYVLEKAANTIIYDAMLHEMHSEMLSKNELLILTELVKCKDKYRLALSALGRPVVDMSSSTPSTEEPYYVLLYGNRVGTEFYTMLTNHSRKNKTNLLIELLRSANML